MILNIIDMIATVTIAIIVISNVLEMGRIRQELKVLNVETAVIGAKLKIIKDKL